MELSAGNDLVQWIVKNYYVYNAYKMLQLHIGFVAATIALVALLPVYSKLLKKIKTSIDVAGNEGMGEIEIANDN